MRKCLITPATFLQLSECAKSQNSRIIAKTSRIRKKARISIHAGRPGACGSIIGGNAALWMHTQGMSPTSSPGSYRKVSNFEEMSFLHKNTTNHSPAKQAKHRCRKGFFYLKSQKYRHYEGKSPPCIYVSPGCDLWYYCRGIFSCKSWMF